MAYPELEFISMQEAANDPMFNISTEKLRLYSEQRIISIYIKAPSPKKSNYSKNESHPHRYAKVIAPLWDGDTLTFESSAAEIMDRTEKPFVPKQLTYAAGFSYANVMIKPSELRKLKEDQHYQTKTSQAAQVLASQRTAERDRYVDQIMMRINEERRKLAVGNECTMINHIRFIKESEVPERLFNSVKKEVAFRIKKNFNECYSSLSRAPKKRIDEPYFLPQK